MANHHGKEGVVKIGSASVAEVTAFNFSRTSDVAETQVCGDTFKTRTAGMRDHKGSLTCFYDPSDTLGQDLIYEGQGLTLLLYFEDGAGSGKVEWSCPVIVVSVDLALERDGIVEQSFAWEGNGAPTEGTVS